MEFYSKDVQILRQSQSKLALEYLHQLNVTVSVEELQRMTDILVECCLKPMDDDLKNRLKKLDKWIAEKRQQNG